jgi:hypothetical protein
MPTSVDLFTRHLNPVLVETGSRVGDGIRQALEARFLRVFSIELDNGYYAQCCKRFVNDPRVKLFLGDSGLILGDVIAGINEPITFWLDAHLTEDNGARGEVDPPLRLELEAIAKHPIKTHTILIDDARGLWHPDYLNLLAKINPNYHVFYDTGAVHWDVLVASNSTYISVS